MGQLEDILKHQNMVRNNIMKSFEAETSEDSLEKSFEDEVNPFEMEAYKSELTKAELDEFEKAKHNDGDMHPNGKWVWRQSANGGKGDWRVAKPSRGGGSSKTTSSASNEEKFADMDIKEAKKKLVGKNLTFKNYWSDGKGGSVDATGKITNVRLYGKNKQPVASVEFENGDSATVSLKQIDEGKAAGYDLSLSASDANKKDGVKSEKSSYESKEADAYDKGDGKVGNYPVPTHTSYPAANLYSRLKNNRHFGFKYGLPEEEIMKKLKDYKGNVKVSYHNNAGTNEIYRIEFMDNSKKDDKKESSSKKTTISKETSTAKKAKVPSGKKVSYDDDIVAVYDDKGKKVYEGMLDYSPYQLDDSKWNEKDKNYDLPKGYKMVGK